MAYIPYTVFRMDYRTVGLSKCRTIGLLDYSDGPYVYICLNNKLLFATVINACFVNKVPAI